MPEQARREVSPRDLAVGRKLEPASRGGNRLLELEIVVCGSLACSATAGSSLILRCAAVQPSRLRPLAALERPFRADREVPDVSPRTTDVVRARVRGRDRQQKGGDI